MNLDAQFVKSVMRVVLGSKEIYESLIHNIEKNYKLKENDCLPPEIREYIRQIEAWFVQDIRSTVLGSKDESQIHNLKNNNKLKENISYEYPSYEDAKKLFESKKYTIQVSKEYRINEEIALIRRVLPSLSDRQWWLLIADKKSGPFITTDSPVNLLWKDPENIPSLHRDSPDYESKETRVYFPISQKLALIGEFDGSDMKEEVTEDFVAMFNSETIDKCPTQIYAPKFDFKFLDKEDNIRSGKDLLKYRST